MSESSALALKPTRGFEGRIQGATLPDLIQMECLGMTTRAVRIDRGDNSGRIFFAGGQVVHAEAGDLRGEPALFELVGWPDGAFTIEEGVRPYEETITRPWQSLLLAAAHVQDELNDQSLRLEPTQNIQMNTETEAPIGEIFDDPEVQSAAQFTEDGTLLDRKGADPENLHATFSYVVQLARLIGESLGAENLHEIHIAAPDYRGLCVVREAETVAMLTNAKANIPAIAKKIGDILC
jgi:hypothetical protein